jgi:hypothetical protein
MHTRLGRKQSHLRSRAAATVVAAMGTAVDAVCVHAGQLLRGPSSFAKAEINTRGMQGMSDTRRSQGEDLLA